jgi:integrase/recombinase XerD
MKVQKAVISACESPVWLVIDDAFAPVRPVTEFLLHLRNVERSPNTLRAYAHHLRLYWEFLDAHALEWKTIGLRELSDFVSWLRDPIPVGVSRLGSIEPRRAESTVNAVLAAVSSFYDYQQRLGVVDQLPLYRAGSVRHQRYKRFLAGIARHKPSRQRVLTLAAPAREPKTLTADQVRGLVEAATRLRDKLLICLLYESGMRIGEALSLQHQDIDSREKVIQFTPRHAPNGARSKRRISRTIHVSGSLMRLSAEYLVEEVQDVSADTVFVNLWREPIGWPLSIKGVHALFRRLRTKTGIKAHPHMFRHTHATELMRGGWSAAFVQRRLGHASIQTTINTYTHLTNEDLKRSFEAFLEARDADRE